MALTIIAAALLLLTGCGSGRGIPEGAEVAFVAPHRLELLAELKPEAEVIANLQHGDRVLVIDRLRRFAKIRTSSDVEGWTDGWMLFNSDEMMRVRQLAARAAALPAQGEAKVYDVLNVHITPNRQSPSLFQINQDDRVDVVSHRVETRTSYEPPIRDEMVFPRPTYRLPPSVEPSTGAADDWSLVRTGDGRTGWALTRMLAMAIPDEVAQYSEGHLITSYFPLGAVTDGGERKQHWLWTTLSTARAPYEFDSFRVFVWSTRRHRYETAYIERNVIGHYPTEVHLPDEQGGSGPQFSLLLRDSEGGLARHTYSFNGQRVRLAATQPWRPPPEPPPPALDPESSGDRGPGWFEALAARVREWFR